MPTHDLGGLSIDLPGIAVTQKPSDASCWKNGKWITMLLTGDLTGVRVHCGDDEKDNSSRGRTGGRSDGRWISVGDEVWTSSELRSDLSLPNKTDPTKPGFFTHVERVTLHKGFLVNVGLAAPLFGGNGGGVQAERLGPAEQSTIESIDAVGQDRAGNA